MNSNSTISEVKTQAALIEMEIFDKYSKKIGAGDLSFDVLDLYFIPDELIIKKGQSVSSKLIFAASNSQLTSQGKLYVNDKKIEVESGFGKVNVPFSDVENSLELKTRIYADFAGFELSKDIKLTPTK